MRSKPIGRSPLPQEADLDRVPAGIMARTSAAALVAAAVLAASAVHLVYAGVQSTTGLQYPGVTGLIPACACTPNTCQCCRLLSHDHDAVALT